MFNKETTTVEEYTIVTCNRCGTRLRVPNDRGNIKVTCPNCKNQFLYSGISNANRKSNKKKPIIIGCIVAVMLLIIFLVPTPTWLCSHQWVEATCTAPRTCSRCGLVEGTALGHNWLDATCTDPKKCSKCGTTEGKPLDHVWTKETRDYPATCEICGKLLPMQMPANGREFFSHVPNRNSALKITSSSSQSYFVKLKDVNGKDVIGFFVRPGQTTTVTVPTGKYQTFFATGTDWYGIDRLFGDDTQYFKDRELLNYTYDEYWEYNLTPTYNGNFSETKIDASEF